MKKNIKILDCTLRDGGRIINCHFPDKDISDIVRRLINAQIDIIELGFLRDCRTEYKNNSTFFTDVEQMTRFIPKNRKQSLIFAFADFGMFDVDLLKTRNDDFIDGIRLGFIKKDFDNKREEIEQTAMLIKKKGYKLFIQGVNTLEYSDKELLELVEWANIIKPDGFGIVDTYGAMYIDDVQRIYNLVDHNLWEDIAVDFHSHNNFQLSFSFAQEIIRLNRGNRNLIIDATLNGMGKCAGNLNTELIIDYLVRKRHYDYDFDSILDVIDDYMYEIKKNNEWGYSIPSMLAGVYKSHPNNIIYLLNKFRLSTKEIKYIVATINPETRQRYDYDNIQKIYKEYNHTKVDDKETLNKLNNIFYQRNILLLLPGISLKKYEKKVREYIDRNNPVLISINFVTDLGKRENRYAFFGSQKRYDKSKARRSEEKTIIVSNISSDTDLDYIVNYEGVIDRASEDFDNTTIMFLNLLRKVGIKKFVIAGFDGYNPEEKNYFDEGLFEEIRFKERYSDITVNMITMLKQYANGLDKKEDVTFLTPSKYEFIFKD